MRPSLTRRYGGTGLAWPDRHPADPADGRQAGVGDEVGKGSRHVHPAPPPPFTLAKAPVAEPALEHRACRGLPVLIADDNRTNRRILEGDDPRLEDEPQAVDGGAQGPRRHEERGRGRPAVPAGAAGREDADIDGFGRRRPGRARDGRFGKPALIMLSSATKGRDHPPRGGDRRRRKFLLKPRAPVRAAGGDLLRAAGRHPPRRMAARVRRAARRPAPAPRAGPPKTVRSTSASPSACSKARPPRSRSSATGALAVEAVKRTTSSTWC